jgi:membrane protease YdiL (CAAX protease family)
MELPSSLRHGPGKVGVSLVFAVALAGLGLGLGAGLVRGAVALLDQLAIQLTAAQAVLLSTVLLQGVAFGSVSLGYMWVRGLSLDWIGIAVPDLRGWLTVASGWILAFIGALMMVVLVVVSGLDPAANRTSELGQADPLVFALLIPVSFLLIGPGEELLFRGIIQNSMVESLGRWPGILLATLLFAAAHVFSLTGPLTGRATTILLLFVPGFVLAVSYDYSENIVVPSLIHGGYNATLFSFAFLSTLSA